MQQIELDGVSYNLPEAWDEVGPDQIARLINLVYLTPESGKMYHALIQLALNIRPKAWRKLHQKHFSPNLPESVRWKNAEVLQTIVAQLQWLWLKPMHRQPFPSIQVNGKAWLLPEEGFKTMNFGELTDLYIHMQAFIQQTVPGYERLNYLVATACRPRRGRGYTLRPDWNGDHREPYNEFVVRERVAEVAKLDFSTRSAVLLYVASNIKNVLSGYELFDPDATAEPVEEGERYAGQGFIKNAHLLAEKHIFGNLKQTQDANLHEVLLFLEEHRADQLARQDSEKTDS
ncbi:hypothetical protein F5984_19920 [Rudanella paleaurantiibacter]|uniref:Uncharacterized protein n=1 Tax=Rudanella paleaurantiibacter TaxID=2614655 RepID=A0A7J5TV59_9BACT|nr:hypothetical protein [Rudanella paleaurantiibacter]KAB7728025.1 hypothetical protein F5984_19920 [Rudanella paleaurantiibacter]